MMRSLEIHFLATKRIPLTPGAVTTTGKRFPSRPAVGGTSSGTGGGGGNSGAPQHRASLTRHRGRHSPNRHVCPICDMSFPWLNLLKRHMRTHVSQQIYSCKDCDYTTRDRRDFAKHVLIHTWHKPHYDELKEESGAKRGKHRARAHRHAPRVPHTRTHPRTRPRAHPRPRASPRAREAGAAAAAAVAGKFRCNQCHLEFASKRLLMRHINCVHGYPERRLSSEESGSSAASSP